MENSEGVKKRARSANWTEIEKISLFEKVLQKEGDLFGNFKGPFGNKRGREDIWGEITNAVNAESNQQRTIMQVKKQYDNMKQIVKKYIDTEKYPRTENAPAPAPLYGSLKLLYENTGGKPGMVGIPGGIDTEDPSTSFALEEQEVEDNPIETIFSFITDAESTTTPAVCQSTETGESSAFAPSQPVSKRKTFRKRSAEDLLLETERERAKAEILKLKEKTKLLKMRRIYEKKINI